MNRKIVFLTFSFVLFLAGLYFSLTFSLEGMETKSISQPIASAENNSCPDLLVRRGKSLLLYNSKLPNKDGENPLPFYNLDEYINYLEIQKKKGLICPVLFLQYESTAQGTDVYRMRPSPFDMQGGVSSEIDPSLINTIDGRPIKILDASRDGKYNQGMFAGFDPTGLHNGEYTELDVIHESTANRENSENPMDFNWGGVQISENAVRSGNYKDRYVTKPRYFTPKTTFLPDIYGTGTKPPTELPDFLKPQMEG
jgi:hypothetical protein